MSDSPIDVGSDRQLFLDDLFFDTRENVELSMHRPTIKEPMFSRDRPWESRSLDTPSIVKDGDLYRMWYRADEGGRDKQGEDTAWVCYAESRDCVSWEKPSLGICDFQGSTDNNIVFPADGIDGSRVKNPSVIIDPNASPDERYKMVARTQHQKPTVMVAYVSPDGLAWRPVETNPILTEGPFDSHNVVVWDDATGKFVMYLRGIDKGHAGPFIGGLRAIRRSESEDFRHWSDPEMVVTRDDDDPEDYHFYTNAAVKYHRAARAFFMFPMTLYEERKYPRAPFDGISDVVFALSRDGVDWKRPFREPFVPPGLDERNWVDRNPMMGDGIVETGPDELSMVVQVLHKEPESGFRRATIRTDGFVSVDGPYAGWGEFTTPPLVFTGSELEMNYSTSGGGSIFVELQDGDGTAVPGFALDDCVEVFGDKIEGAIAWNGGPDLPGLAGSPVRMRVRMRDAELYAFRFK